MPRGKVTPQPSTSSMPLSLPPKRGRPSLSDLILRAVCLSPARKGTSLAVIKKTLVADGYDVRRNSGRLKAALNSLVNKGLLERVTGSGVAGSFRIGGVGNEQVERKARRGRAAGGARRRRAKKRKGPKRAVKATAQRLKKPSRPRARAKAVPAAENRARDAAGGAEEEAAAAAAAEGAEVEVAEAAMEGMAGGPEAAGDC
ncbi:histone H1-like [Strigops habroptila]|uniref:histone H1-like n=1 Tax=Strigops habroptila TaxID=2489341 RepID=UPI0011CFBD60|nr:histone H1-like [Strigops habroptila]